MCAVLILFSFFAHPFSSSFSGDCKTSPRPGCRRRRLHSHRVCSSRISNPMDSLASEWKFGAFQWFCSSNNKSQLSSHWRLPLCGRKCGGKCIGLCSPCCKRSVCFVHIPVNRERVIGSRDWPRTTRFRLAFLDFFFTNVFWTKSKFSRSSLRTMGPFNGNCNSILSKDKGHKN